MMMITFSCTCQPHRKLVQPQRARHLMNCWMLPGLAQSLNRAGSQRADNTRVISSIMSTSQHVYTAPMVRMMVARGVMSGSTE